MTTAKRYYYRDALAAAWMAEHHGMKFGIMFNCRLVWDWCDMLNTPHPASSATDILEDYPHHSFGNLYIHPDSLHLLKVQMNDVVFTGSASSVCIVEFRDNLNRSGRYKIIQRNNTAFMWPESEDV